MDTSYVNEDSYETGPNQLWGAPNGGNQIQTYGGQATTEGGFYDNRDDMVGGADTRWNTAPGDQDPDAGNWASYGDVAPVVNSASGLGGERAKFSGTMSQGSLAGGSNPDSPYGH